MTDLFHSFWVENTDFLYECRPFNSMYEEKSLEKTKDLWVLTVSLPSEWKTRVDKSMKEKGYRTYAEYIRDLVRRDLGED